MEQKHFVQLSSWENFYIRLAIIVRTSILSELKDGFSESRLTATAVVFNAALKIEKQPIIRIVPSM